MNKIEQYKKIITLILILITIIGITSITIINELKNPTGKAHFTTFEDNIDYEGLGLRASNENFKLKENEFLFQNLEDTRNLEGNITDTAIYKTGYYWVDGEETWIPFTLQGENESVNWILNHAEFTVPLSFNNIQRQGEYSDNLILTYSCTHNGTEWDCHENKWQARAFKTIKDEIINCADYNQCESENTCYAINEIHEGAICASDLTWLTLPGEPTFEENPINANNECETDNDCNDGNSNTVDTCTSGVCSNEAQVTGEGFIVDHTKNDLNIIPDSCIQQAKDTLHVAYQHTSHGSQLVSGLNAIEAWDSFYSWSEGGSATELDLDDYAMPSANDLGYEDDWAPATRTYLDSNPDVNVILWSWCNIAGHDIPKYLADMESLITDYPNVKFVFMTGHVNGGGEGDTSDTPNTLIRDHVNENDRILFDFADMEEYDPDGNYYLDKYVNDNLDYDSTEPYSTSRDANWADEYIQRHPESKDLEIEAQVASCAHSQNLNCALKGQATWYMLARLAGWDGVSSSC